jgi:hypothetical protein
MAGKNTKPTPGWLVVEIRYLSKCVKSFLQFKTTLFTRDPQRISQAGSHARYRELTQRRASLSECRQKFIFVIGTATSMSRTCLEQKPAGDFEDQTVGPGQIGRRYLADKYFAEDTLDPMNGVCERFRMGTFSSGACRPLTSPDLLNVRVASA